MVVVVGGVRREKQGGLQSLYACAKGSLREVLCVSY